jgi:response regulator RpfG family c-di-GMP phosphodiesterase
VDPGLGKKRKIVLIGDDLSWSAFLSEFLLSRGFEVHAFSNCAEGMAYTLGCPVGLAALVVELLTPDFGTWELLEDRGRFPDVQRIPVIVTSALWNVRGVRYVPSRNLAYLGKPFHPKLLVEVVERMRCEAAEVTGSGL